MYKRQDLIDINVYDEEDKPFGILKDVIETGANDVYDIKTVSYTHLDVYKRQVFSFVLKNWTRRLRLPELPYRMQM